VRIALLVPDGVGVRNFIAGPFLREAADLEGCILHTIPDSLLPIYQEGVSAGWTWHRMPPHRETALSFTLRHALGYAHIYWGDSFAMRAHRNKAIHGSWRTRAAHFVARAAGRLGATPGRMGLLARTHCRVAARDADVPRYVELLRRSRPAVLFCSHQRPPSVLPAVLAARRCGIPTATFIFSWDNLTSKARIAAPFDYFLVWSERMKQELLRYYPDVSASRVRVAGTPQFDPYADKGLLWSREEFFRRLGADAARPLICYSGGDAATCPEDPLHAGMLAELIRAGRIRGNPQLLVRPSPVDDGQRYAAVRAAYPEAIFGQPAWVHPDRENWAQVMPLPEDIQFLANLTHHASVNVNVASTMTLDFALHDRPVVNIAFDMSSPGPFPSPLAEWYYRFEHYQPVVQLRAARLARSPEELADHVNAYLEHQDLDREERRRFVNLELGAPLGAATRRIIDALLEIGGQGKTAVPAAQATHA
jgi:hypothetical protein